TLACGSLDDLSVALTGMHPADVWLTRLESNLPHSALVDDLQIEAASTQRPVSNWLIAATSNHAPCPLASGAVAPPPPPPPPPPPGPPPPPTDGRSRRERRDRRMIFVTALIAAGAIVRRIMRWRAERAQPAAS